MTKSIAVEQSSCDACLETICESEAPGILTGCWPTTGTGEVERYKVQLCRSCFLKVISGLSRDRMLTGLFSEEPDDFKREGFGRVTN